MDISISFMLAWCAIALSGCAGEANYYGGIEKEDIPELTASNIELVQEFKGHGDNWGSTLFIYKVKNSEKLTMKGFLVTGRIRKRPAKLLMNTLQAAQLEAAV
ncbi:hypothetical protein [Paenibacillus humicola]|uniref:hypothetical protein n=1 Tax=Paenibacillus humicola TaxID=3110540 RepID=UPI00237A6FE6|nr:hypothetical protein [Paenibacillus humicola]